MAGLDPYNLQRFLTAQEGTFAQARAELAAGQKQSHWMWFIFPQIRGLGSSSMAHRYAISGIDEGSAYLQHPVLGARLRECTALVNAVEKRTIQEIFGYPDDLKFHSSITLFARVADVSGVEADVFREALANHFAGRLDMGTLRQLDSR